MPVSVNTQINRLSMRELPDVLETIIALGAHAWQIMLTVAMGRAADAPELLLQPYDLLELFPLLARLKERCDGAGVRLLPGNNIGYFGPYEPLLRRELPRGHKGSCGAGCTTLGHRGRRRRQGLPFAADGSVDGRQPPRCLVARHLGARRAPARDARSHGGRPLGLLPHLLLRRRMPRRLHLDGIQPVRADRQQSALSSPGARDAAPGLRERLVQVAPAPGAPFDHGLFEIVVEAAPQEGRDEPAVTMPRV